MKKISILFLILFFNICSTSENRVISISEDTTTQIINEEDYPIVLANCLNEEMGYNIATPFDIQDLKSAISQLSNNKKEESQLSEDVDFCISKYNLWSDSSSLNPGELAKIYDENLELAKCLRENGLNVPDPNQQDPKVDLSGLKESKDEIMPLLQECGWQK